MARVVTFSAMSAGTPTDPGVWSADCARYQINDQQGVRARWGLMTGGIDPRWPFANCDGSIETQGPSGDSTPSMSAVSESGINGPDAALRFGKVADPLNAAKSAYLMRFKQGDSATLKRCEMSFSPTFTPMRRDMAAWVACSMLIPSEWKAAAANDETNVWQIHETPDGGDDTQPAPMALLVKGRTMFAWVRSNPNLVTLAAQSTYTEVFNEADYPADVWQHWVFKIRAHWDSAQSPRIEAWRALGDAGALTKVIDYSGPNTYNNTASNLDYAKHGVYYYAGLWTGSMTERVMHSKGLYQWLDGQGINQDLILAHLRSI